MRKLLILGGLFATFWPAQQPGWFYDQLLLAGLGINSGVVVLLALGLWML